MVVLTHGTNDYHSRAYGDPALLVEAARIALADVDYTSMVGTGLSGALVVPTLARALGKEWAIIRKSGDDSHSSSSFEGRITTRWLFVDDFISTGATFRRVRSAVDEAYQIEVRWRDFAVLPPKPVCVGSWSYQRDDQGFTPFN